MIILFIIPTHHYHDQLFEREGNDQINLQKLTLILVVILQLLLLMLLQWRFVRFSCF